MSKRKLAIIILCPLLMLAIILSVTLTYHFNKVDQFTVIAKINGMDIYAGELIDQMSRDKSYVVDYYNKDKNLTIDNNFWVTPINGQTPQDYLREYSMKTVAKYKLLQQLGMECHFIKDASYKAFLNNMESENSKRATKISGGDVVYGQQEYDVNTYYEYISSNLSLDLCLYLSKEGRKLYASEEQRKKFYMDNRQRYSKVASTKYDLFNLEYKDPIDKMDKGVSKYTQDEAEVVMNDVKSIIEKGGDYKKQIAEKYPDIEIRDFEINNDNYSNIKKSNNALYDETMNMKTGDVSDVVCNQLIFSVMKCISTKTAGYEKYEDVKEAVLTQYNEAAINNYIDSIYGKNPVEKLEKYSRVKMK